MPPGGDDALLEAFIFWPLQQEEGCSDEDLSGFHGRKVQKNYYGSTMK